MRVKCLLTRILIIALVVMLIPTQFALAKGPDGSATIRGPGLSGDVEITDPTILKAFTLAQFENFPSGAIDAPQVTDGYLITTYFGNHIPFDQFTYYLDPSGGIGYVFYNGIVDGGSEYDGKWYRVTHEGDLAMHRLLTQLGVLVPTHLLLPTAGSAKPISLQVLVVLGIGLILSGLILLRHGRVFARLIEKSKG